MKLILVSLVVVLLALALCAFADDSAPVVKLPNLNQPDKSGELGRELDYLCQRQLGADCRDRLVFGGESYLKDLYTKAKPGARMGEHQIRPLASLVFAGTTLLTFGQYDEKAVGITRREMGRIMVSLTRELAEHHISNADKTSWWWGDEWQSPYWTAILGQGAWMMWDRLPKDVQRDTAAMIVHEADRFLKDPAPHNEFLDTKAEENAWDSEVLVLAECMMPTHPNAKAWEDKAREYMVTAFATPEDVKSSKVIDGKPLNQWLHGPNVHSDFTLENHGFFHPDYESAYYLNLQNLPVYKLAGFEAPESMLHNTAKLRDILNFLTLPNGWTFYPQCTDWNNYRHDVTIMAQSTNPVLPSAEGARCLRWGLDFIKYADSSEAGNAPKNLFRGMNFNCCPLDTMTHVYLQHYLWGPGAEPLSDEETREKLAGTRLFEQGKCVVCRSKEGIASFSWFDSGKRLMAAVTPMAPDAVALPKYRSLIGTIGDQIDDVKLLRRETEVLPDGGFAVGLSCERGPEGKLKERVMMVALPDGRVIYAEWFDGSLPADVEARTGLVFFENNPFWLRGTKPKVYHPGGTWEQPNAAVNLNGDQWLNVTNRFGIVVRGSKSVLIEDGQLVLNHRSANADIAPRMIAVFYPNMTRQGTERADRIIKAENLAGGAVTIALGDALAVLNPTDNTIEFKDRNIAPLKAVIMAGAR